MTTYSAVRTTGIYCRPGCPATPKPENVHTFTLAAAAEAAGYRACLRCRPYRVAGTVEAGAPDLVCRAVRLIVAGALDGANEDAVADRLGVSARHLRRLFHDHLGVTPDRFARTHRAHFARRLLDDSDLSITDIAFAAGYGSLRQFNRAMRDVFRAAPRDLRARRRKADPLPAEAGLALRLPVTPGYSWPDTLVALRGRVTAGVDSVEGGTYRRSIVFDGQTGAVRVGAGGDDHLLVWVDLPQWHGIIHLVARVARLVGADGAGGPGEWDLR